VIMRTALLLLISMAAVADTAADIQNVFSGAAEALINDDAAAFLEAFDRNMPDYAALRSNIEGLLAAYEVGSTIEVITDEGDDQKRTIDLDWLLITTEKFAINSTPQTRRAVIKCRLERQGRRWKITGLDPVDFFKK
jgi:hypothetical protein